jgi:hypothetical protein
MQNIYLFMLRLSAFLLVFLSIVCVGQAQAQDAIIRIYGDTVFCKIDQEDSRFIYYRTAESHKGETEIISRKEIRTIIYGLSEASISKIKPKKPEKAFETIQFSVHAGYSWILSADELYGEDFDDFYDDMRGGPFIDARLNYFLTQELGLGLLYSTSRYETDPIGIVVSNPTTGNSFNGELLHNRNINYYALNVGFRSVQASSNINLQLDIGLGILTFEDNGRFISDYRMTDTTLGGHLSGSFRLGLGQGFYLPAFISLKGFRLGNLDIEPSDEMEEEVEIALKSIFESQPRGLTMSRVQFGVGLGVSF